MVKLEHSQNVDPLIVIIELECVILFRLRQYSNAAYPIEVTEFGIIIFAK